MKTHKATITSSQEASDLCKLLKQLSDKKMKLELNGKSITFSSIVARKQFVSGLETAVSPNRKKVV